MPDPTSASGEVELFWNTACLKKSPDGGRMCILRAEPSHHHEWDQPDPTSADPEPEILESRAARIRGLAAQVDTLRAELDALRAALAQNVAYDQRATEAAWQEVRALRARLVQTEAVVQAVRAYFVEPDVAADRYQDVIDALATLPEAPPVAAGSGK